jgi:hypothetical protein
MDIGTPIAENENMDEPADNASDHDKSRDQYDIADYKLTKTPKNPAPKKKGAKEKSPATPAVPKKKALLIGISYAGSETYAPLNWPHADVHRMHQLLLDQYGYAPGDIVMLLDSGEGVQPTRVNIVRLPNASFAAR